jgi:pimeloyl-ACP methyl ester carboxylesterase
MKRVFRYWLVLPIFLLSGLFLILPGSLFAQSSSPAEPFTFESAPCMFDGVDLGPVSMSPEDLGFECGYVTVPEQHSDPSGPTIRLPVAIRQAIDLNAKPDPLFLAQGGPGGSAFELFSLTLPNTPIAQERDIVIFNQRGTVYAEPELVCTELREALPHLLILPPEEGDPQYIKLLGNCYQRLQNDGINLSAFNSLENAADVDAIRRALGYDEYNFYGVSYGTLLGLHLMQNHPDHLRSVILDSVVPPQINFILQAGRSENRIYDELFGACNQNPTCAAQYPNLENRFWAVVEQLNQTPTTISIIHPDTGEQIDVYLNGDILLDILYMSLYVPGNYATFPKIIDNLEAGDFVYLEQIAPLFLFDDTFSEGMYYAIVCAEDADFDPNEADLNDLQPQLASRIGYELQAMQDSCALWPVDQLPPDIDDPVVSDIPTLLLSGRFDPITPPAFAAAAANTLENGYNIVDPLASHGVAFGHNCINQITQDFLDNPDTEPDSTCLSSLTPLDTVPTSAITLPILSKVANLDSDYLTQSAVAGLFLLGVLSAAVIWLLVWVIRLIMNKESNLTHQQKWLRRISRLLVLGFGFLGIVFVVGLVGFIGYVLVSENSYLYAFSVPGIARLFLIIPPFLLLLTIAIVIAAIFIWRQKNWSIWDKAYYTFLAACAVGYVSMLAYHDFIL